MDKTDVLVAAEANIRDQVLGGTVYFEDSGAAK